MPDVRSRLVTCFHTVFEGLSDTQIEESARNSMEEWDSVAAITLVSVLEEEFNVQIDYERLPEFDTFSKILNYLTRDLGVR